MRILLLAADPSDMTRLAIGEEQRAIDAGLRASDGRDDFQLVYATALRIGDLADALQRHRPDIVHFSGHGDQAGELVLLDADGNAAVADVAGVVHLFESLARDLPLRCVFLSACYSSTLARALTAHVDCVIGVAEPLDDRVAVAFAGEFYRALGFGRDVVTACSVASAQVRLAFPSCGALPEALSRPEVRAESVRFVATPAAPAAPAAPCNVPRDAATRFVGRVDALRALDAWRAGDDAVTVVHGPPGVGKTRLATEWALRQRGGFSGGAWYVSLRGDAVRGFVEVARLAGVARAPDERDDAWAARARTVVGAAASLWVFDDAQPGEAFEGWLRDITAGRVIVVSTAEVWPAGYAELPLDALAPDDARALVRQVLRATGPSPEQEDQLLARAAGNAVQLIVDASAVYRDLRAGRAPRPLGALAPEAARAFDDAWASVADDVRVALCALGRFRAQATPTSVVAGVLASDGWGLARFEEAVFAADDCNLVTRAHDGALTLHPLMRTYARARSASALSAAVIAAHARRFVACAAALCEEPSDGERDAAFACDEFDEASWRALGASLSTSDVAQVGDALSSTGRYDAAIDWCKRAVDELRRGDAAGRVDHAALGENLHLVGLCLTGRGLPDVLLALADSMLEDLASDDDAEPGPANARLDAMIDDPSASIEGQPWFEEAVAEQLQGDLAGRVHHDRVAQSMRSVAECLATRGLREEAVRWYERALEQLQQCEPVDPEQRASLVEALANARKAAP